MTLKKPPPDTHPQGPLAGPLAPLVRMKVFVTKWSCCLDTGGTHESTGCGFSVISWHSFNLNQPVVSFVCVNQTVSGHGTAKSHRVEWSGQ